MYKFTILFTSLIGLSLVLGSCRKCMECSYSFTKTSTEFTPNGEVTITDTVSNETLNDENGFPYYQVCGNDEERQELEDAYINAESQLEVDDYSYRCFDY